jgi:tetratricopeptide (TPR) repeat protein
MKDHNQDIEMIEKYLAGKMTDDEKKMFAEVRIKDHELNAMLDDMDHLIKGIKHSAAQSSKKEKEDRLKFFNEIMDMEEDASRDENASVSTGKVVPFYRKPSVMAIAASIVLMISVSIIFIQNRAPLNERLYTAYYEPFDSPGSGLTRGSSEVTLKAQAYGAYDNGHFAEAAVLFEKLIAENKGTTATYLCLGNAYLAQGQLDKAEASFNHVATSDSDLVTQAHWYLALTYLKQNKLEKAKAALWIISDSSTYGEKAKKLLKDLD